MEVGWEEGVEKVGVQIARGICIVFTGRVRGV